MLPDQFKKKTDDLEIIDKIKLGGLLLEKYKKTGDLDIVDIIKLRGLLGELHQYCQHKFVSFPLNFKIKFDIKEDFARK